MKKFWNIIFMFFIILFCTIPVEASEIETNDWIIYHQGDTPIQDCQVYLLMHSGGHRANEYEPRLEFFGDAVICSLDYTQWGNLYEDYGACAKKIIQTIIPQMQSMGINMNRDNVSIVGVSQGGRYIAGMIPDLIPYVKNYGILSCSINEEQAADAVKENSEYPIRVYYCASVEEIWYCQNGYNLLKNYADCKITQTLYGHTWKTWDIGLKEFTDFCTQ